MKSFRKKLVKRSTWLCVLLMTFLIGNMANAQNPYLNNANSQLRAIFGQITFPSSNILFLYERSAKLSDSTFYQNNSPDTLDQEIWLQLYDELYYAAHDTLPLKTHAQVENFGYSFGNDTISIGIIDYDWYYLNPNTLDTNIFFNFDIVNNVLQDNPSRPNSPFGLSNIFAVAPMQLTSNYLTPTFRIDPFLFLSDLNNTSLYNASSFRLDFGDGTGWHYFDPNVIDYYSGNYSTMGKYGIIAELLDDKRQIIKKSTSEIEITGKALSNSANEYWDIPGLNVGVYSSCNGSNEKVIIFLEGIDILDMIPNQNRTIDQIYEDMIHNNYIEELRDFNYAFYVVDWKNSRIDMRFNALYVVSLIEKLKKKYKYSDEQFVIIGESMGGLVGRYALTYMESKEYAAGDFRGFFVEALAPANAEYLLSNPQFPLVGVIDRLPNLVSQMHKTRELITLDTPHQGASIPIGVQVGYQKLMGGMFPALNLFTNLKNIGLGSYAAKQMLLYHLNGKVTPASHASAYLPAPEFYTFFTQLSLMGNYPKYAKLMALSNGAMDGFGQTNDLGVIRTANDVMINLTKYKEYKLFGKYYPLFDAQLTIRSNPNGSGQVYHAHFDFFVPHIQLSWFKITIGTIHVNLFADTETALNVKPYCVSAGGYIDFELKGHFLAFGFIPLQSALDYGKGLNMPLNHNIASENINTKLSRTPFDVIVGYPDSTNYGHLYYRDEGAYNITDLPAINCGTTDSRKYAYFDAANANLCDIKRGLLNLEIGDEEMYIENWTLNRGAIFQAQYDVHVNERNPYYQYPSHIDTNLLLAGIYSKENKFQITANGYARFLYNTVGAPSNAVGFSYTAPMDPGLWTKNQVKMDICLNDYSTKYTIVNNDSSELFNEGIENYLNLIPNPSYNTSVLCSYQFKDKTEKQTIQLFDVTGSQLLETFVDGLQKIQSIQLDITHLKPGMYFVIVDNGIERMNKKLLIK